MQAVGYIRDVNVEDLFGRKLVILDMSKIFDSIKGKMILVMGVGGFIGFEICCQISLFCLCEIVFFGYGENSIYFVYGELLVCFGKEVFFYVEIVDIQDRDKIFILMKKYELYVVYYVVVYKYVLLMEYNLEEVVKNNIFGIKNVVEVVDMCGMEMFVLIFFDKVVNLVNVMGVMKWFVEMVIMNFGKISCIKFVVVCFGNVFGSWGSVILIFKKQIVKGGFVIVMYLVMIRYFMMIFEVLRFVIQVGVFVKGWQIFVLDMGEFVKIVDLVKNLIYLLGYMIEQIFIEFFGIWLGEKMYEELLNYNEVYMEQIFLKIYIGKVVDGDWVVFICFMEEFSCLFEEELRKWLFEVIELVYEEVVVGV